MELIEQLNFVKGAVAHRTLRPELSYFRISNGYITATNGILEIGCPTTLQLECAPNAKLMYYAINNSKDSVALHLTPTGRLGIKSGKFKTNVPCIPIEEYPSFNYPQLDRRLDILLLDICKCLSPFIGEDASRPWCRGICIRGTQALATNNVMVALYPIPESDCNVVIPAELVQEILRIGIEPEAVSIGGNCIHLYYANGGHIISTTLSSVEFPKVDRLFERNYDWREIPVGIFEAVEGLMPFSERCEVTLLHDQICSHVDDDLGAHIDMDTGVEAIMNGSLFHRLKECTHWSTTGNPFFFANDHILVAMALKTYSRG